MGWGLFIYCQAQLPTLEMVSPLPRIYLLRAITLNGGSSASVILCLYICIYLYVCMYTCFCIVMYLGVYLVCGYICLYCIYICPCVRATCKCECEFVWICIHVCTCGWDVCVCMCAHGHICARASPLLLPSEDPSCPFHNTNASLLEVPARACAQHMYYVRVTAETLCGKGH